ncbi:unnamed protein product [Sphenostylis stenocarpa]|uniref:PGG domain-containing protein n=1 Tax=Sphenostylis stenocarpa TaxID=92480 RepID=A0AA86SRM1_9FABA|nr:unnamed protein product [Sphenostylis stenocarpa]
MEKRWKDFKEIMKDNRENILKMFDLFENNAIHVATRSNDPKLLKEMIALVPEEERWQAMFQKNGEGNTVLHEAVLCKRMEMVKAVFAVEDGLQEESSVDEKRSLLEVKNSRGETPFFVAAMHGKLEMLKLMAIHFAMHEMGDFRQHLRRFDEYSALHASVIGQHFDVAYWLLRMDKELAKLKDKQNLTCLQLLAKMPEAFRSNFQLGPVKSLLYMDEENVELFKQSKDLESGKMEKRNLRKPVLSDINYKFWKSMAKEFEGVGRMWKEKKKHKLVEGLVNILVQYDLSWQISCNESKMTRLIRMPYHPFNVPKRRRLSAKKMEERRSKDDEDPVFDRIPLLIAAKTGIEEIVEKFFEVHPEAISHVNNDGQNILHVGIRYRQNKILKLIERKGVVESLVHQITKKGRTILHEIARMDYYKAARLAGVAFQLQDELRWYDKVRSMIPEHYIMHCDVDGHTAEDMLENEHDDMLKEAQKWLKETAQSCSTVAILVATVVFAAAYTVPGGTENGTPVLLHSGVFLFFTIMDVVALATSLASVVVFLSILTSPCELWDFHKSLPRKLNLGFALLFLSLMTTMLAFSATMLLTIRLEWKNWTSTLIYSAAFFPVTIFAMIQFPVIMMTRSIVDKLWKQLKRVLPIRLINCLTRGI